MLLVIEEDLNARSIAVYALLQDVIRQDATTVAGAHDVIEGGCCSLGIAKMIRRGPKSKP